MNWALLKFSADKAQTKELRTKKKRRQEICNTIVFCDLTLKDENALRASSSILRESKPLSNVFLKHSRAAKNSGHPSGKKILYFCFKKILEIFFLAADKHFILQLACQIRLIDR